MEGSTELIQWHLKTVLIMVGLPARGKSYISKKLVTYHSWMGLKAKFFNVGNHRRDVMKGTAQTSNFFDSTNSDAKAAREAIAMEVLGELLEWLRAGGDVAVFDATNTTEGRRREVLNKCKSFSESLNVLFVESICTDPEVIRSNMLQKAQGSPDYRTMPLEQALADLARRIENYERVYETIADDSMSYIKLINLQSKVICNRIFGSIAQSAATFLMSLNLSNRSIWLCRAGHVQGGEDFNGVKFPETSQLEKDVSSTDSISDASPLKKQFSKSSMLIRSHTSIDGLRLPRNSSKSLQLSASGQEFAQKTKQFVQERVQSEADLVVYSSTLPRAVQTAHLISPRSQQWSALNMLDTGLLNGLSIYEIKKNHPGEFEEFMKDPFNYRLPGGESFQDVAHRVEPFIIELERQTKPCLVISHLSTLRVILSYFLDVPNDQLSTIDIPQHTIIQLVPSQYGWQQSRFRLELDTEAD